MKKCLLALLLLGSFNIFAATKIIQCDGAHIESYPVDVWGVDINYYKLVITDDRAVTYFYDNGFKPNFEEVWQQFIVSNLTNEYSHFEYVDSKTEYLVYPFGSPSSNFSLSVILRGHGEEVNWVFNGYIH